MKQCTPHLVASCLLFASCFHVSIIRATSRQLGKTVCRVPSRSAFAMVRSQIKLSGSFFSFSHLRRRQPQWLRRRRRRRVVSGVLARRFPQSATNPIGHNRLRALRLPPLAKLPSCPLAKMRNAFANQTKSSISLNCIINDGGEGDPRSWSSGVEVW